MPRQGCCANGFAGVTWRLITYEPMERLCTLVQQGHGLGWSYNDDDALVATLGHGLSRDLTTFDTWELIDL